MMRTTEREKERERDLCIQQQRTHTTNYHMKISTKLIIVKFYYTFKITIAFVLSIGDWGVAGSKFKSTG